MGWKEQSHEEVSGLAKVMIKVCIRYHHHLRLNFMLINNLFDPATDTVCVAGPAHHIENRFCILYVIQCILPLSVIFHQKTEYRKI